MVENSASEHVSGRTVLKSRKQRFRTRLRAKQFRRTENSASEHVSEPKCSEGLKTALQNTTLVAGAKYTEGPKTTPQNASDSAFQNTCICDQAVEHKFANARLHVPKCCMQDIYGISEASLEDACTTSRESRPHCKTAEPNTNLVGGIGGAYEHLVLWFCEAYWKTYAPKP
jgi:hypothetical protein